MAKSDQLRQLHQFMQLNGKSKHEDEQIAEVVSAIRKELERDLGVKLEVQDKILLSDLVSFLRKNFPSVPFANPEVEKSFMKPDGGITYLLSKDGNKYPILIGEVKNQGTNDKRLQEGLKKQAKGNAVERLGKNVIGLRTYLLTESIFPYVCFGDGCDFEKGSSILDRVLTIAMFGELNTDHTANCGQNGLFNRGSYYFRDTEWTLEEMYDIMYDVAKKSILYYFSKYGENTFIDGTLTVKQLSNRYDLDSNNEFLVAEDTSEYSSKQ